MSSEHHDDPFFEFIGAEKASGAPRPEPLRDGDHRVRLSRISSRAWEHPADRAALAGLRKVPGLDALLRRLVGLIGERSLRLLALANAVRVGEQQFARVHERYVRCCEVLDVERRPELFVTQTPVVNAGAVGVDEPFILLHSATLELLDDDELDVVLAHELGHILSDHVLYKTMLRLLLELSLSRLGIPLGDLALAGIVAALREWDRKSELSADRAALLAVQDPRRCYTVHMKLAGGNAVDQMSLDAFIEQAQEYHRAGSAADGLFKLLNLLGQTHPFHVTRLAELARWVDAGAYEQVLAGHYPRRDHDAEHSVYDELKGGAQAYRDDAEHSEDALVRFVHDATATVTEAASSVWSSTRNLIGRITGDKDPPPRDRPDRDDER